MIGKKHVTAAGVLLVAVVLGMLAAQDRRPRPEPLLQSAVAKEEADTDRAADRDAIRKATESFVKAFSSGEAKTVASHWTTEGEFISDDGTTLRGRAAIEKAYAELFKKNPKPEAEAEVQSLRFLSRDTAVEEGFFKVRRGKKEEKVASRYSVLHVREDGKWLMAVVREWPGEGIALRDLEWLIGSWSSSRDGVESLVTYEWDLNKSFIKARFDIRRDGRTLSGTQMIGKDPSSGHLRSWTFEGEGGFGHAVWSRDGNKWLIEAEGVGHEGSVLTATNILIRLDDDAYTWQSTQRTHNGEEQANLPPIKVTRVKGKK